MNELEQWRDNEIKKVGLQTQLEAETIIEKHYDQPLVNVWDEATGKEIKMRRHIADIQTRNKKVCRPTKSFSVPNLPCFDKSLRGSNNV